MRQNRQSRNRIKVRQDHKIRVTTNLQIRKQLFLSQALPWFFVVHMGGLVKVSMAQRRMFSKSITNSSAFIKMPATSRLLYYDLGMNADDDGYCEHFIVMRMTGSSDQDLKVLEANGLIQVFNDNVLIIKHWKENNYIKNDRYTPSAYLGVYVMDTECLHDGYTGKVRIGKVRENNSPIREIASDIQGKRYKPVQPKQEAINPDDIPF